MADDGVVGRGGVERLERHAVGPLVAGGAGHLEPHRLALGLRLLEQEADDLVVGGVGDAEQPLAGGLIVGAHGPGPMLPGSLAPAAADGRLPGGRLHRRPGARRRGRGGVRAAARVDGRGPVDARPAGRRRPRKRSRRWRAEAARRGGGRRRPGVAALAAERLGLSGNPPEAAAATRDKAAMRRALAAAGVPQPQHRTVGPNDERPRSRPRSGFPRRKAALAVGEPRRDPGG